MYVAFHEPHAKIASPPELVEKYKKYESRDAEYLANIENLDGAEWMGRELRVNKARPRDNSRGGGGGNRSFEGSSRNY